MPFAWHARELSSAGIPKAGSAADRACAVLTCCVFGTSGLSCSGAALGEASRAPGLAARRLLECSHHAQSRRGCPLVPQVIGSAGWTVLGRWVALRHQPARTSPTPCAPERRLPPPLQSKLVQL